MIHLRKRKMSSLKKKRKSRKRKNQNQKKKKNLLSNPVKKPVLLPNQNKKSNPSHEKEMTQILTKLKILLILKNQSTLILKCQGIKWGENSLGGGMIGLMSVLLIAMKMKNQVAEKNALSLKETKKRKNQILKKSLIS